MNGPRTRPSPSPLAIAGLLGCLLIAGCDTFATRTGADPDAPTAEERVLLDRLQRDNFLIVTDTQRNDDGYLVVTTSQGQARIRYIFSPANEATKQLTIHRLIESMDIVEGQSNDPPGTGPAPRGLEH